MTAAQGLVEMQQGPVSESVHFSPEEGSNWTVIKPTFNTQSFLQRFWACGWLVIEKVAFARWPRVTRGNTISDGTVSYVFSSHQNRN